MCKGTRILVKFVYDGWTLHYYPSQSQEKTCQTEQRGLQQFRIFLFICHFSLLFLIFLKFFLVFQFLIFSSFFSILFVFVFFLSFSFLFFFFSFLFFSFLFFLFFSFLFFSFSFLFFSFLFFSFFSFLFFSRILKICFFFFWSQWLRNFLEHFREKKRKHFFSRLGKKKTHIQKKIMKIVGFDERKLQQQRHSMEIVEDFA